MRHFNISQKVSNQEQLNQKIDNNQPIDNQKNISDKNQYKNPVILLKNAQIEKFTRRHNQIVDQELLNKTIMSHKSIELDMYFDNKKKKIVISHSPLYYEFYNKPIPDNLDFEFTINKLLPTDVFVCLDIKNREAINEAIKICKLFGSGRILIHMFIKELNFLPYEPDYQVCPHWDSEHLTLEDLKMINQQLDHQYPIHASCRGLTQSRIDNEMWQNIIIKRLESFSGQIDVLSLFQPNNIIPSDEFIQILFNKFRILPEIYPEVLQKSCKKLKSKCYFGCSNIDQYVSDVRILLS